MVKESRAHWVAVEPETTNNANNHDDGLPSVTQARSAYQIFQKQNSQRIKQELIAQNKPHDLANLTKAISHNWHHVLTSDEKEVYEEEGRAEMMRFRRESHLRDVAVEKRREKLRQERNELLDVEGGRSTRGARKKEMKKAEKKRRRKEEKKEQRQQLKKKSKKKKIREIVNSDEDEFEESESSEEDDEDSDESYGNEGSDNDDDSSSDESVSDSDDSNYKKKKAPPRQVSAAVLARREQAKMEKEVKETYIAGRQEDLRSERAAQAKKRLDFLLKQSDIFRHFGQVKEDSGKFHGRTTRSSSNADTSTSTNTDNPGATNRRDATANESTNAGEGQDQENEVDEYHEATYLTTQPSTLGFGKMRAYQLEGLNWMIRLQENGVNGIMADEMGLGKTLQSISIMVYMMEYKNFNGPHLVVVPKSTLSNWMSELKRWAPTLNAVKFHGKKEEREMIANDILQPGQRDEQREWHVCVTTYEVCNMDKNILNKFAWSYLIIDEAHRLKNETSTFSKTIRAFETRYRLLLTGTPLQNNLHELWALLNFLVPDVFASAAQFDEWFNLDIDDADEKNKLISQLHKILRPFMLRRLKVDVEKSLPPKHETILFTGMSAMQKKLYKDILLRDVDLLQGGSNGGGGSGGGGSQTAILNIVMQLRKCAGHPYLFPGAEDRSLPPLGEHLVENCGKMVLLDKLLIKLRDLGHRVLLFTQMTRLLDILEDYMVMRQFKYCRIDGNTDYEKREDSINAFNAPNSEKFMFLLSTRAGGLGINLQTADVVILYDSDWNPQADLQAQDRAHRIGQKRPVQVFRLVTEHTIEEKVVERAQQKLKLDAMVVQQGRLKEKDKVSRDELLAAVRFGADKVFKSKDSSITDDDIDLILEAGKKKTQELNEKLMAADKGDMLDFKLDGKGDSVQTYEGVDYSKQDHAQIKAQQAQAEMLGILDMGKRERRPIANYNENQLYRQQIALLQGEKRPERKKKEKEIKLPKHLRLPRLDEWQMFDRDALNALQDKEERVFRDLSEEMQNLVKGKPPSVVNTEEDVEGEEKKTPLTLADVPPLLSDEEQKEKDRLLSEGFADWGRFHYVSFLKASAKYGREEFAKIAIEVGKPQISVEDYASAFWDENFGKKRFSEKEYDRSVQSIEKGEKKIQLMKVLETGTSTFLSLFDNPWQEAEFTFHNCKDKLFTVEEDRHLLCWAHKYGYGQWDAVKMAIRRSPDFRFDYYLRSLPIEAIGRRCEQLMKAADKEVELMTKKAREDAGLSDEDDSPIQLPRFKELKEMRRKEIEDELQAELEEHESKVEEVENQIEEIQKRLKDVQKMGKEMEGNNRNTTQSGDLSEELLPELANLVAKSGHSGVLSIANIFLQEHGQVVTKKTLCAKIEDIAKKEKRSEEGDARAVWHLLPEYMHLLSVETIRSLRKEKEERLERKRSSGRKKHGAPKANIDVADEEGAEGPEGDFVTYPTYTGEEEPRDCKKAFTLFCNATRKEIKSKLDPESRRDKHKVNGMLKERWLSLSNEEKNIWRGWEVWDAKRNKRDIAVYEKVQNQRKKKQTETEEKDEVVPKKRKDMGTNENKPQSAAAGADPFQIPKKKKIIK